MKLVEIPKSKSEKMRKTIHKMKKYIMCMEKCLEESGFIDDDDDDDDEDDEDVRHKSRKHFRMGGRMNGRYGDED